MTGNPRKVSARSRRPSNQISSEIAFDTGALERIRNLLARSPGHTSRDAAHRDALERVSRVVAPRARRADQRAFASTRA